MSYIISLGVGFVVGLLYWLLKVQSPAPPLVALAGLLGMVLGEHAIPVARAQFMTEKSVAQPAPQVAPQDVPSEVAASKKTKDRTDGAGS